MNINLQAWYLPLMQDPSTITLLIGGALLGVTFLVLQATRWGQSNPVTKCVILSVLAHLILVAYAYSTNLVTRIPLAAPNVAVPIRLAEADNRLDRLDPESSDPQSKRPPEFWNQFSDAVSDLTDPKNPTDSLAPVPQSTSLSMEQVTDPGLSDLEKNNERTAEALTQTLKSQLMRENQDVIDAIPASSPSKTGEADSAVQQALQAALSPTPTTVTPIAIEKKMLPAESAPAAIANFSPNKQTDAPTESVNDASQWLADQLPSTVPGRINAPEETQLPDQISDLAVPENAMRSEKMTSELSQQVNQDSSDRFEKFANNEVNTPAENLNMPPSTTDATTLDQQNRAPKIASRHDDQALNPTDAIRRLGDGQALPQRYQLRQQRTIAQVSLSGGSPETEQAIARGLKYLAEIQQDDGSWNPRQTGGGRELQVLGHDRQGAGAQADTGITGLALLSFLAAGNSHLEGPYKDNVRKGLEYLAARQQRNGSLAGSAQFFAQMYCHSMALLAISEAYSMTGDPRLQETVQQGVRYSVDTQNHTIGGWRYRPGESGDMSQFGWQVMALGSAGLAGTPVDEETTRLMKTFLTRHSQGRHGGLAIYRHGEQPSPTMTAEALFCRYLLQEPTTPAMVSEACAEILGGDPLQTPDVMKNLPGNGVDNVYFWYYATLALHQAAQAEDTRDLPEVKRAWETWNEKLKQRLLALQQPDGEQAGSWDPNWFLWGCYGGRVYSTSMANLCLQVYYRYDLEAEGKLRVAGLPIAPLHIPQVPIRNAIGDQ